MNTRSDSLPNITVPFLSGAFVIILLALLLAPGAFAAKPEPKACKPHPKRPDSCGPVGHGMPPGDPTVVGLSGEFTESGARNCQSEGEPMNTRGNYDCLVHEKVQLGFQKLGEPVSSRKNLRWMCDALNGEHQKLSLESYIYGWTDVCDDGICDVEVRLVSRDPILQMITFGKSDRVEITLFAQAAGLDDDAYPFDQGLTLDIHSIETDYKKTGSTRTAIVCHHDLATGSMPVTFTTDPQ